MYIRNSLQFDSYRELETSRWEGIVSASFLDHTQSLEYLQTEFLEYMETNHGKRDIDWSCRWQRFGVDIRLKNYIDISVFLLTSV